jgi:hypothetical protein
MEDERWATTQSLIDQARIEAPAELHDRLVNLQLELWALRDLAIAGEAATANLEWRLVQYDHHAKGLENLVTELRKQISRKDARLVESEKRVNEILNSWTYRLGRFLMKLAWPLRVIRKPFARGS